uniref:DUF418 domain-containing protein n=1 Tax=Roseihalotalea indica TaxID=2867963 RepID=A0AA49JGF6_9BACT|nr:DUF418 domain-containing protein [Tunicatimonas sp. TK19036]
MAAQFLPKTSSKRITVIDALRGFALLTVLLTHYLSSYSGYPKLFTEEQLAALPFPELDHDIFKINQLFFKLKSRVLFSFLFGLGFYFQIEKSERLGISFRKTFIKRLLVMLLIGLVHTYLILWGDILRWYFIAGLFLLILYRLNSKIILGLCILLSFVLPTTESILEMVVKDHMHTRLSIEAVQNAFLSGSYWQTIKMNYLIEHDKFVDPWYFIGYVANILGFFFLGLWAGKINFFKKLEEYQPFIIRGFIIGGLVFIVGGLLFVFNPIPQSDSLLLHQIVNSLGYRMDTVGLFVVYVCGFILLYRTPLGRYLEILVPVGKMTLTNYIMQSVVAVFLFNGMGLGLLGKIGPSFVLPIALSFFAFQVVFSHVWLHFFYTGPLEWVWRIMVSGKFQPLRKQVAETAR